MDHFERQLAQMMCDTEAPAPFEPKHRERLWAGVRVRYRRRAAQRAVGSVLAVVGLSVGLFLLPGYVTRVEPSHPRPQPATSRTPSAPPATSGVSPSAPSSSGTSTAPASPDGTASITPPASRPGVRPRPPRPCRGARRASRRPRPRPRLRVRRPRGTSRRPLRPRSSPRNALAHRCPECLRPAPYQVTKRTKCEKSRATCPEGPEPTAAPRTGGDAPPGARPGRGRPRVQ